MRSVYFACVSLLLAASPAYAQAPAGGDAAPAPAGDAAAPGSAGAAPAAPAEAPPPAPPPAAPPPPPPAEAAPAPAPAAPPPPPPGPRPAPAGGLKIETPAATIKFGLLAQPAFEAAGATGREGFANNLFVRRARLLVGATLFKDFELFFDTDFADLFKGSATTGTKNTPGMFVQDAFATWKAAGDAFKIDLGYMLPPLNHNSVQGAGTLYSWDYFSNAFRHTNAFNSSGNPIGRDAGLQFRGLVLDGHIEYRLGVFQGRRNPEAPPAAGMNTGIGASNMFRLSGRLQINLLDAETGFFYAGSYLGAKKILSIGGAYEFQDSYKRFSVDAFADLPLGPGVFTAQVNFVGTDGDDFLVNPPAMAGGMPTAALPKQNAIFGEVGYLIDAINVSPIFRFEKQTITATDPSTGETRIGGGLAFWPYGHNVNVKAFYQHVTPDPTADPVPHGYDQINVQTQVYVF